MQYTYASLAILLLALAVTVLRGAARDLALWLGLLAFAALTVLADSLLIRVGVFRYASATRSGIQILAIPLEDLLYGCALYLTAIAVWSWNPGTRRR